MAAILKPSPLVPRPKPPSLLPSISTVICFPFLNLSASRINTTASAQSRPPSPVCFLFRFASYPRALSELLPIFSVSKGKCKKKKMKKKYAEKTKLLYKSIVAERKTARTHATFPIYKQAARRGRRCRMKRRTRKRVRSYSYTDRGSATLLQGRG
ncbi:hypothetical protein F4818DRAFT_105510 [Hypoxylon cercidicola]|nr:hypothetical protein F4818DRAFT_105510 [Hypoxylon cercidicola]